MKRLQLHQTPGELSHKNTLPHLKAFRGEVLDLATSAGCAHYHSTLITARLRLCFTENKKSNDANQVRVQKSDLTK